jgi:hypothetical protein
MSSDSELAARIYKAVQDYSNYDSRSMQAREFKVGVSDLGFCSERTRRMLDRQTPEDSDVLAAFIGTAIGDHVERAVEENFDTTVLRQEEVSVTLRGEKSEYVLTGHPDLIVPDENLLIDVKTTFGLGVPRKNGPSNQQQYQRHCYAKGAWQKGLFGSAALEDVLVANAWLDRSAQEKEVHVDVEPYSEDVVDQAGQWLDDVVYAYLNQEEARKEPPREMCAAVCGFFGVCRAHDTDVQGLIEDREILGAIELYREGQDLARQGEKLKKQASAHLQGVSGSTREVLVRWVHVNESVVPTFTRAAYDKLEVRKIPKPKAVKKG